VTAFLITQLAFAVEEAQAAPLVPAPMSTTPALPNLQALLQASLTTRSAAIGRPIAYSLAPVTGPAQTQYPGPVVKDPVTRYIPTPKVQMLGTWVEPAQVRLRWMPSGEWIPEGGYTLYRTIAGKRQELARGLGRTDLLEVSPADVDRIAGQLLLIGHAPFQPDPSPEPTDNPETEDWVDGPLVTTRNSLVDLITEIRGQTRLTPEVRQYLIDQNKITGTAQNAAIEQMLYSTFNQRPKLQKQTIISGADRFNAGFQASVLLETGAPKMPTEQDGLVPKVFLNQNMLSNLVSQFEFNGSGNLLPRIATLDNPPLLAQLNPNVITSLLENRDQIGTYANVNFEMALASGLAYVDDLSGSRVPSGAAIKYELFPTVAPGTTPLATASVTAGKPLSLKGPTQVQGYGLNQRVFLRWDLPKGNQEEKIISGYVIERAAGATPGTYAPLNPDAPAVVSYLTDENGVLYEPAAFYTDEGKAGTEVAFHNGDRLWYRVYGVDMFGRTTAPTQAVPIDVVKTTPPPAPNLRQPEYSPAAETVKNPDRPGNPLTIGLGTSPSRTGDGGYLADGTYLPGQFLVDGSFMPGRTELDGAFTPGRLNTNGTFTPGNYMPDGSFVPGKFQTDGLFLAGLFNPTGGFTPGRLGTDGKLVPGTQTAVKAPVGTIKNVTPAYLYDALSVDIAQFNSALDADAIKQAALRARMNQIKAAHGNAAGVFVVFTQSLDYPVDAAGNPGAPVPASDLAEYRIYRADATGTGEFGEPELLNAVGANDASITTTDLTTEAIVFDTDVAPGHYYAYWVTARDRWGNESPWSNRPSVVGVPLTTPPPTPAIDSATFTVIHSLADRLRVPGFYNRFGALDVPAGNSSGPSLGYDINDGYGHYNNPGDLPSQIVIPEENTGANPGVLTGINPGLLNQAALSYVMAIPDLSRVHALVVVGREEIAPDGKVRVMWYPDANADVKGYKVYRAFDAAANAAEVDPNEVVTRLASLTYTLVSSLVETNEVTDTIQPIPQTGCFYYVITKVTAEAPPEPVTPGLEPGGYINVTWQASPDPQVQHYQVFRAEVPRDIAEAIRASLPGVDPAWRTKLVWTMVADSVTGTRFTEMVTQSMVHYYIYRIRAVNVWGEPSASPTESQMVRVPTTVPPLTPHLLTPIPGPGQAILRWKPVAEAQKYVIYRSLKPVPVVQMGELSTMVGSVLSDGTGNRVATTGSLPNLTGLPGLPNNLISMPALLTKLDTLNTSQQLKLYQGIYSKYGALALAPYAHLNIDAAKTLGWLPVQTITTNYFENKSNIANDVVLKWNDNQVDYPNTYLYTIEAVTEDGLASDQSAPVSAQPYKGKGPAAPEPLQITPTDNGPKLTWTEYTDYPATWQGVQLKPMGYIVYRAEKEAGPYYQCSPLLTEATFTDTAAPAGRNYWYRVVIVDEMGLLSAPTGAKQGGSKPLTPVIPGGLTPIPGGLTPVVPLPPLGTLDGALRGRVASAAPYIPPVPIIQPPAAPTGLAVTGTTSNSVSLSWQAVSGAASYNVYRWTSNPGTAPSLTGLTPVMNVTTGTSCSVTGLNASTTYYFAVQTVGPVLKSGASGVVSGTTRSLLPGPITPPPLLPLPGAPARLTATQITSGSVTLTWVPGANVTGHKIYMSTVDPRGSTANMTVKGTTSTPSASSFQVTGLNPATRYFFAVTGVGLIGESSAAFVEATTAQPDAPAVPAGLTVTGVTSDSVSLSWNAVKGATKYRVYGRVQSSGLLINQPAPVMMGESVTTTFTVKGLQPLSDYEFAVTAVTSGGESAPSTPVTAKTKPPVVPIRLTISGFTLEKVSVEAKVSSSPVTYRCSAELTLSAMPTIPVTLSLVEWTSTSVSNGTVSLRSELTAPVSGATLNIAELELSSSQPYAKVTGGLAIPGVEVLGDQPRFWFDDARLTPDSRIQITRMPSFISGGYLVNGGQGVVSFMGTPVIQLTNTHLWSSLGQITRDNNQFEFTMADASLGFNGKLTARCNIYASQSIMLAVPRLLELQIDSAQIKLVAGAIDQTNSRVKGRVLLPFKQGQLPINPGLIPVPQIPIGLLPRNTNGSLKVSSTTLVDRFRSVDITRLAGLNPATIGTGGASALTPDMEQAIAGGINYALGQVEGGLLLTDTTDPANRGFIAFDIPAWDGLGLKPAGDKTSDIASILIKEIDPEAEADESMTAAKLVELRPTDITLNLPTRQLTNAAEEIGRGDTSNYIGAEFGDGTGFLPSNFIELQGSNGTTKRFSLDISEGYVAYDRAGLRGRIDNEAAAVTELPVVLNKVVDATCTSAAVNFLYNKALIDTYGTMNVDWLDRSIKWHLFTDPVTEEILFGIEPDKTASTIMIRGGTLDGSDLILDGAVNVHNADMNAIVDFVGMPLKAPIWGAASQADKDADAAASAAKQLHYGLAMAAEPKQADFHGFTWETRCVQLYPDGNLGLLGAMELADTIPMNEEPDADQILLLDATGSAPPPVKVTVELDYHYEQLVQMHADLEYDPIENEFRNIWDENGTRYGKWHFTIGSIEMPGMPVGQLQFRGGIVEGKRFWLAKFDGNEFDPLNLGVFKVPAFQGLAGQYVKKAGKVPDPWNDEAFQNYETDSKNSKVFFVGKTAISIGKTEVSKKGGGKGSGAGGQTGTGTGTGSGLGSAANGDSGTTGTSGQTASGSGAEGQPKTGGTGDKPKETETKPVLCLNPVEITIGAGPDLKITAPIQVEGKTLTTIIIGYYHPQHRFYGNATIQMKLPFTDQYSVAGGIGVGFGDDYWIVDLGYPQMLQVKINLSGLPCKFGAGFSYEHNEDVTTLKLKAMAGIDTGDITLGIVYLKAYVSATGELILVVADDVDFTMTIRIQGGAEGGIKVKSKKYKIISLGLDLLGTLSDANKEDEWVVNGKASVSYSIDLWLFDISGSVPWDMSYKL
jgi:fibronectin type 3 domain-containing protein